MKKIQARPHPKLNRFTLAIIFVVILAVSGTVAILSIKAATFSTNTEAESGTLTGGAAKIADAAASGGQSIRFGTTSSGVSILKPAGSFHTVSNLRFSNASSKLLLDLHIPNRDGPYPLLVWVYGGGWQGGSKDDCYAKNMGFVQRGFAVACISYRLSQEAKFPAQIEDVKAAIRWLRTHGAEYNIYTDKIGIWGLSAGGHLTALAGTSGGATQFDKGENLDKSSSVQAVVDYYGPTDLIKLTQVPGFSARAGADSPESQLIGGPLLQNPDKVAAANPITYITPGDPPFLIYHGTSDTTVPYQQSQILDDALKANGVSSKLTLIQGAGHGGPQFETTAVLNEVSAFLDKYVRP